jgi:4-amino-4-deoxy-L-arabinose transferase-like glycosyltransferase
VKFALHLWFNGWYGYFRDEFDYIACANHPAWGYVDHPPLIPMLVRLSRMAFGDSLRSIRFVPALASSLIVVLAAMIASELGGRRYAQILTALAVSIAPIYLSDGSLMTTNCLEPLLWVGAVYCAILAVKRSQPRWWLGFGAIAGVGLEEKYSIAILGLAMVAGLLATPERRHLAGKWMWMGAAAAALIFAPNAIWNFQNHWPFLELARNIRESGRDVVLSPLQYFVQQILLIHPLNALLWIAGLAALFRWRPLRPYRMLGWCYLAAFAAFGVVLKGKNYYLAPIYPMLLAAGAVWIEHALEYRPAWLKPALAAVLVAGGIWLVPVVVPVLSVDQFLAYARALPFAIPRSEHSHERAAMPQHYADQFGWLELVDKVNDAWQRLTPAERPACGIFAQNYGQAGAIDFFGPWYGLPAALSGHQTYYLWGPRGYSGNCLIVVGDRQERLEQLFERAEYVGESDNPYALARHVRVFICKGAKFGTLAAIWPRLKNWD